MKRKRTFKIPHRRRREGRTDYRKRFQLLKSGKARFAIRKSTNSLVCQIISYQPTGDKTVVTADVEKLKKLGWKAHGGNIPTAYLVGYLAGSEAKKKGINSAVADLGLYTQTRWSRIYAALKGAVDAGLDVPHSPDILPPEDRVSGKHIVSYAAQVKKEDAEEYNKLFSSYLKNALPPEDLEKHLKEIKGKIGK